jgi:hypothetical protein
VPYESYPADWATHKRAAGPIRNQQMLDTGIDLCIGFHPDITKSKGTKDMLTRASKAGIPTYWNNGTEEVLYGKESERGVV